MGYRTVIIICNDKLRDIDEHPEHFARELARAIRWIGTGREKISVMGGAAEVIGAVHASHRVTLRVEGGTAEFVSPESARIHQD